MKLHAILSFALFLTPACLWAQAAPVVTPELPGYRLVWADEFNEDGAPDAASWECEEGFVRNNEAQWYQKENATVHDGVLVLTARREHRANPHYNPASTKWGERRDSIHLTSASVQTRHHRLFHYGRIQVRARIPASRGSWPAIWLKGEGKPWPHCGEVDVMEFYEKGGVRSILANACYGGKRGESVWNTKVVPFTHFTQRDSLWATQFHLWEMEWDASAIRISLDGELLNNIPIAHTIDGRDSTFNALQQPMYLLLNLAMGSSGGRIEEATLPARYEVDYVRVYAREADERKQP